MTTKAARNLGIVLWSILATLLAPSFALAAEEGGGKWGGLLFIGRAFNLAVVVGLLVWIARKPLANFFASRSQSIREQLAEARQARTEAEAKLAEMESRMSRLDDELREIRETGEREARAEYDRLLEQNQADAEKILQRARQDIDGLTRAARIELRNHAADLAVRLAEERIRGEMNDEDRSRLVGRFVTKLGEK